jgi:hypothetical protein
MALFKGGPGETCGTIGEMLVLSEGWRMCVVQVRL